MIKFSQCPICLANFNNNLNEPRILFKFGNSLCLKCLNEKINFNEKNFTCPIDKIKYENINSIESFPKNIALIDLLQTKNIEYLTSPQPKLNTDKFKLLESIKKFSEKKITQYCKIHPNKNLEIICLDDKCKICTNCALFGEHKNHNIINIDDFEKEIEVKSEVLIDLFDTIEKKFKELENSIRENENRKMVVISEMMLPSTQKILNKIGNLKIIKAVYKEKAGENFRLTTLGVALGVLIETFSFWSPNFIKAHNFDPSIQAGMTAVVWVIRALSIGIGIWTGSILALFLTETIAHFVWNIFSKLVKKGLLLQAYKKIGKYAFVLTVINIIPIFV